MAPNKVTRVEVIDHRSNAPGVGRAFVAWDVPSVELSYQDDGRTLKIFLSDAPYNLPPTEEKEHGETL